MIKYQAIQNYLLVCWKLILDATQKKYKNISETDQCLPNELL